MRSEVGRQTGRGSRRVVGRPTPAASRRDVGRSEAAKKAGEPRFGRAAATGGRQSPGGSRASEQTLPAASPGGRYAIEVEGYLGDHWSEWLDGMTITYEAGGVTRLNGPVIDQAALHGLLNKLWGLRLPIVTIERLAPSAPFPAPGARLPDRQDDPQSG